MGVVIKLKQDSTALDKLQSRVAGAAGKMKSAFSGVGAKLTAAFGLVGGTAAIKGLFDEFARIGDLADRLGTTGEEMQRLSQLAVQGGADVEILAKAMTKVNATINAGDAAAASMADRLESMGINAKEFAGAGLSDQMIMLARAYEQSGRDGKALSNMLEIIGVRGADLIPVFQMGSAKMSEMMSGMKILSESQVQAIKDADDAMQEFAATLKATAAGPLANVAGYMQAIIQYGSKSGQFNFGEALAGAIRPGMLGEFSAQQKAAQEAAKPKSAAAQAADDVFGGMDSAAKPSVSGVWGDLEDALWGNEKQRNEMAAREEASREEARIAKQQAEEREAEKQAAIAERDSLFAERYGAARGALADLTASGGVTAMGDMRSIGGGGGVAGIDYQRASADLQRQMVTYLAELSQSARQRVLDDL